MFDSGLIGEGVLHLLLAAKHKLLQRGAALVPQSATVYCQPIQARSRQLQRGVLLLSLLPTSIVGCWLCMLCTINQLTNQPASHQPAACSSLNLLLAAFLL